MDIRGKIEEFRPFIPLIQGLRNPGMRTRHWQVLSEHIKMNVKPKANLTFARCLEMGLQNHVKDIALVAEVAGKEYAIEQVRTHSIYVKRFELGQACWYLSYTESDLF